MKELSLNVLDIVQNSLTAGADLVQITVEESGQAGSLVIEIEDNGCGMSAEVVQAVTDPFYTTRATRNVGMGLPLFKMAAEQTGGSLDLWSEQGVGTRVTARFVTSHVDMTPLGDINGTVSMLILTNPNLDFVFRHTTDKGGLELDTRQMREILGDVPLDHPDVTQWMREYLRDGADGMGEKT